MASLTTTPRRCIRGRFLIFIILQNFHSTNRSLELLLSRSCGKPLHASGSNPRFYGLQRSANKPSNFQDVSAAGDEWSFIDAWAETNTFYNPINDQNMPFLAYDYLAERKVGYYVYKLIIPIVFLILLSWVTFFIKINELNSRVTISIVCFLSLIAYNFVVDDNLPKLTYLTFMDKFILISYIFSGIPTIQTVFVEYLSVQKRTNLSFKLDRLFRNYFLAAYLAVISVTSLTSGLFLFN